MDQAIELVRKNEKETIDFFGPPSAAVVDLPVPEDDRALTLRMSMLHNDLFRAAHEREKNTKTAAAARGLAPREAANGRPKRVRTVISNGKPAENGGGISEEILERVEKGVTKPNNSAVDTVTVINENNDAAARARSATALSLRGGVGRTATSTAEKLAEDRPTWHAPWKMYRTISGHIGWVRCAAVDTSNRWFVTGSADRTIKIWSLASGKLQLTLTGHVAGVRALAVSSRHPYLFSAGEDKTVKCWDLEQNKVVRSYHGHLSGVYSLALHPTLDIVVTAGRDAAVRVWDMRTRTQVYTLTGHRDGVNALLSQRYDPQVVSASVDGTIRLWDLVAARTSSVLTNHKRGVRALAAHPSEYTFASASADAVKSWAFPHGEFMRNFRTDGDVHRGKLVNALAINEDGVMASCGNDGGIGFWDFPSAHCFQQIGTIAQPGSMDCETGVFDAVFDRSGSRLITCETDKTIKMWKEDPDATPESHPLNWKPDLKPRYY